MGRFSTSASQTQSGNIDDVMTLGKQLRWTKSTNSQVHPSSAPQGTSTPSHLSPLTNLAEAYDAYPVNGVSAPNLAELIQQTKDAKERGSFARRRSSFSMERRGSKSKSAVRSISRSKGKPSPRGEPPLDFCLQGCDPISSVDRKKAGKGKNTKQGVPPTHPAPSNARGTVSSQLKKQSTRERLHSRESTARIDLPSIDQGSVGKASPFASPVMSTPTNFRGPPVSSGRGAGSKGVATRSIAAGSLSTVAQESGITVAVRIRPFNRKEVEELMAEQARRRHNPALTASARLAATLNRTKERQPFGPGHEDLYASLAGSLTCGNAPESNLAVMSNGEVVTNPLENCELDQLLDDNNMPIPVTEVLQDGHTLLLNDPFYRYGGGASGVDHSSEFQFDYIYSAFAPSEEVVRVMEGSGAWGSKENSMDFAASVGAYGSTSQLCDLDVDLTPEEEMQTEAEQLTIFQNLGLPLIDRVLEGYNACILAYGQTGSGKTYTMMGDKKHIGLIPRLGRNLFARVDVLRNSTPLKAVTIKLSYMEIYNDQVRDLLKQRPKNAILHYNSRFDSKDVLHQEYQTLKVRHNPSRGVFVEGITCVTVERWEDCAKFLRQGNALRTQASTAMNATSSRSHAIFQLTVTQTGGEIEPGKRGTSELVSKINLVDLAGSERNSKSDSMGKHLQEATSINTSLSTLRRVIEGIVMKKKVVPYRENLLTYILSDNFGGNSKTVMCANVSPHAINFNETDSTLRYASIAKEIVNQIKVNDHSIPFKPPTREVKDRARVLQDMLVPPPSAASQEEKVASLQNDVRQYQANISVLQARENSIKEQLHASEAKQRKLLAALKKKQTHEEIWRKEAERQRQQKEKMRNVLRILAKEHPEMIRQAFLEDSKAAAQGSRRDSDDPPTSDRRRSSGQESLDSFAPDQVPHSSTEDSRLSPRRTATSEASKAAASQGVVVPLVKETPNKQQLALKRLYQRNPKLVAPLSLTLPTRGGRDEFVPYSSSSLDGEHRSSKKSRPSERLGSSQGGNSRSRLSSHERQFSHSYGSYPSRSKRKNSSQESHHSFSEKKPRRRASSFSATPTPLEGASRDSFHGTHPKRGERYPKDFSDDDRLFDSDYERSSGNSSSGVGSPVNDQPEGTPSSSSLSRDSFTPSDLDDESDERRPSGRSNGKVAAESHSKKSKKRFKSADSFKHSVES